MKTTENLRIHMNTIGKQYETNRKTIGESLETVGTQTILNGPQIARAANRLKWVSVWYRF